MDSRSWLLVEWADEQDIFSNYAVVNSYSVINDDSDLQPGKVVFVRGRRSNVARKAHLLKISDNKQHVKELKQIMERQDNRVKSVLSLCMNTIKEMKTGSMMLDHNRTPLTSCSSGPSMHHSTEHSSSSTDSGTDQEANFALNMSKATVRYNNYQVMRSEASTCGQMSRIMNENTMCNNRTTFISSTPLPERREILNDILTFDQASQTDPIKEASPEEVDKLETMLKHLHGGFMKLVSNVRKYDKDCLRLTAMLVPSGNTTDDTRDESGTERQSTSSADLDVGNNRNANVLRVRRVSAQTTNTGLPIVERKNDTVSLGNGHVVVPARLMTEIDWTSYTAATRQLLQAVFPRNVLATHSLSGKQSPAFANKAPKKRLDPTLVDDIVITVSQRCGVPKRIVRSCITIKCTDEAKLYRNRQQYKNMRDQPNRENLSPSPTSSNES